MSTRYITSFDTRQSQESLLTWAGVENPDYYEYLKNYWTENIYTSQNSQSDFQTFFDQSLQDGVYSQGSRAVTLELIVFAGDLNRASSGISSTYKANNDGIELALYETIAIGDGSQANNPWIQETPDPITKACWENYLTIPQAMANQMGIKVVEGNTYKVNLRVGDQSLDLPAIVQPGQTRGTVGLAIGYGRTKAGRVANGIGVNAFPLIGEVNGLSSLTRTVNVGVELTGETTKVAHTQTHHTFMNREFVVQETTLDTYKNHPEHAFHRPAIALSTSLERDCRVKALSWMAKLHLERYLSGKVMSIITITGP